MWGHGQRCLRPPTPERPLALCRKQQEGNTGAPGRARSPLPSQPYNPESFPCECGWGFLEVCRSQASPGRCGSEACGPVVSTPQGRVGWVGWEESRQGRLPRLTSRPQVGLLRPGWVSEQTFVSACCGTEVRVGRSSRDTGQAQLEKLQAGLVDGNCHFRVSHWMWLMRGTPHAPPHRRGWTTTLLPVRPSAGSR